MVRYADYGVIYNVTDKQSKEADTQLSRPLRINLFLSTKNYLDQRFENSFGIIFVF